MSRSTIGGPGGARSVANKSTVGGPRSSTRSTMMPGETKQSAAGPAVSMEELFSYTRHSKFNQIKEALDYLPNKPFDESFIQVK